LTTLVDRLRPLTPTLIALEATGGYEATVAATLASTGLPVAVVNPRQVRDFARATGLLAKTDILDARVIAHFAEAICPATRPVPDAQRQHLGELVTPRRQLVEMLGAETNRRRLTRTRALQRRLDAHIAWLERTLQELETDLHDTIRSSPVCGRPRISSPPSPVSARSPPVNGHPNVPRRESSKSPHPRVHSVARWGGRGRP
jgi:transposase